MFSHFDTQTRQILTGNILLVICCVFYLLWWFIAFHPTHAVKGIKSGWLLIPAFVFGLIAIIRIIPGCVGTEGTFLLPNLGIAITGIIIYAVLLAVTYLILKRQVTSELILITGWAVLAFVELNCLYALGQYTKPQSIIFFTIVAVIAAVSFVCYILYYNLDGVKSYIDGTIPLALIAIMTAVITAGACIS